MYPDFYRYFLQMERGIVVNSAHFEQVYVLKMKT